MVGVKENILKIIAPNIETFKRFPISVACSLILYGIFVFFGDHQENYITTAVFTGFFTFGIARVMAEAHGWNIAREFGFAVLSTALLTWVGHQAGQDDLYPVALLFFVLSVGLAPFAFRVSDNFSFWFYNRTLWTGVALAVVSAAILTGGLSAALASIEYLFEISLPHKTQQYLWMFGMIVYAPFMALSAVPRVFDVSAKDCPDNREIAFMLNWVLAPLALLYFIILYAYGLKILIEWEMPRGMVASLVSGFGTLGIAVYLVGWPLRESGNAMVKFLYRYFFLLLLPPVVMMFVAVFIRIGDYGVTEERYMLVAAAIWLAFNGLLYAVKRDAPLKYMFLSLAVLCLITMAGPVGAARVSTASQISELKEVLARNNMLVEGKAVPFKGDEISFRDEQQISSIVAYFNRAHRREYITEVIPAIDKTDNYYDAREILTGLGLRYIERFERAENYEVQEKDGYRLISFHAAKDYNFYDVGGYDVLYPSFYVHLLQQNEGTQDYTYDLRRGFNTDAPKDGTLVLSADNLTYRNDDGIVITLDIASKLKADAGIRDSQIRKPIEITAKNGRLQIKLVVTAADYRVYKDGSLKVENVRGYFLIRR